MIIPGGDGKLIERGISAFVGCYLFLGLEMPSPSVLDDSTFSTVTSQSFQAKFVFLRAADLYLNVQVLSLGLLNKFILLLAIEIYWVREDWWGSFTILCRGLS